METAGCSMYGLPCPLSCLRVKEGNAAHVQIVESYVNFSNNIHTYIYICIPGDSKWPFYPLVGGHLTFGRVTFSPSRKGHQQNCQVYIYIFGRNRGWKRGKWSRNCPWAVLHLDLFDSIDGVSVGLVTCTFDLLIQEIFFGHRQHKHPHENTQKKMCRDLWHMYGTKK